MREIAGGLAHRGAEFLDAGDVEPRGRTGPQDRGHTVAVSPQHRRAAGQRTDQPTKRWGGLGLMLLAKPDVVGVGKEPYPGRWIHGVGKGSIVSKC